MFSKNIPLKYSILQVHILRSKKQHKFDLTDITNATKIHSDIRLYSWHFALAS